MDGGGWHCFSATDSYQSAVMLLLNKTHIIIASLHFSLVANSRYIQELDSWISLAPC